MGVAEDEGAKLHDADEAGEILYFSVWIATVEHAGEVEKFGTLIDLCPEAFLESFFGVAESSCFFYEIEMGQDTNDFGKTVRLENVEKFKSLLRGSEYSVDKG